ncbi:MAG: hypothetical protein GXP16_14435 [Gammaproteobacteria bacterium]|nr:hypothetical protein [Gammaproteobacteria bacterium]
MPSYLFMAGGAYNAAIARMLLAMALWWTLDSEGDGSQWAFRLTAYQGNEWVPKGLVKLFFDTQPPIAETAVLIGQVARYSIVLMLLGFASRLSSIVAAISTTLVVSLHWSFFEYWSHAANVQLLAALAFMFCRSGDRWSVDWLLRKIFCRPDPFAKHDGGYWWPVLAAELATHLFMFGAFYSKITVGDGVWWALSDNLRNSIGVTWGAYRFDAPALAVFISDHEFVYKLAGLLQLFTQAVTIFALFMTRLPLLRLIVGGGFFFAEILGLTHIFEFWHLFWVPLCLLSVDWEWASTQVRSGIMKARGGRAEGLSSKVREKPAADANVSQGLIAQVMAIVLVRRSFEIIIPPRFKVVMIATSLFVFFGYYVGNIVGQFSDVHLNYPFSSMGFYSENRDTRPYGKHKYYPFYRGWVEVQEVKDGQLREVDFRSLPGDALDPLRFMSSEKNNLEPLHGGLRARFAGSRWETGTGLRTIPDIREVRTFSQIVAIPPLPQPAFPVAILHSGLLAVEDELGIRGVHSTLEWNEARNQYGITTEAWGFRDPKLEILVRRNVRENPQITDPSELPGQWVGSTFWIENTKETDASYLYSLIRVIDVELEVDDIYIGPQNFQSYR